MGLTEILLDPRGFYRALRDRRVRQALNYALNKPEMLTYILNRVGHAGTSGFVPLPGQGPNLTWRGIADDASMPTLEQWHLGLGDIELF